MKFTTILELCNTVIKFVNVPTYMPLAPRSHQVDDMKTETRAVSAMTTLATQQKAMASYQTGNPGSFALPEFTSRV